MTRRIPIVLAAFLLLTVSACGALRAASAKQGYINTQMQDYVYDRPLTEIWPHARTILFEANYQVRDTGEATVTTLETEWHYDDQGTMSRYLVQGIELDQGARCQVLFTKQTRGNSQRSPGSRRDHQMEWQLVQSTDPARAAQIEQDASAQGESARNG